FDSKDVGVLLMDRLSKLDEVSYVRFASVYRQFKDITVFLAELKDLIQTDKNGQGNSTLLFKYASIQEELKMNGIGKILPVEGYIAILEGDLPVAYQTSLSHLYQPLLGPHAVMLYQTLLGEVDIQRGKLQTHHTLMNYLNLPLDDIYYSRLRLEGIGLMKTYETEMENRKVYIYELQCPFSPGNFFQDDMLSQLLYHHIGENTYKKLERSFTREDNHTSLKQVTASFHDVFKTYTSYSESTTQQKRPGYKFGSDVEEADFTYIEQRLLQQMIPVDQVLTGTNKRLILQMKE